MRWLDNMEKLPSWPRINEALYAWAAAVKDQTFVTIRRHWHVAKGSNPVML